MSLRNLFLRSLAHHNKLVKIAPCVSAVQNLKYNNYEEKNEWFYYNRKIATALLSAVVISTVQDDQNSKNEKDTLIDAGAKRPDLPTFRAEEVSKHDNKESFWVIYKYGVYDVTSFLPSHPGGEQIMNAAGYSIEPFWNVYGMHKTQEVYKLLESYRIGNLHDDDVADYSDDELWVKEPYRDKRLIVKTAKPFNAEIPPQYQIAHFDTPNELFYVRQHMPVPELSEEEHTVTVTIVGDGTSTISLTLQDIERFPQVTVRAALMCAGNRRSEMNKVKPVKGLSWQAGAISCATWRGALLRDVLLACGLDPRDPRNVERHIIFTGADIDATGTHFSTSLPLNAALAADAQVLLATHMNGERLPLDHGYPLRVVVPGAPAVRSVKWLQGITISTEESPSHWHQKDYRSFNPSKTWETADFSTAPPVYSLPVTSAVCQPLDGDTVTADDGHIDIKGYAYSGGGAKILRVDVSLNGGASWEEAELVTDPAPPRRHYAWALWSARLRLPDPKASTVDIWVKATDSNFNTQPENFDHIWNIRGILSNAYNKIKVNIKH
ncbi:sulfite oxidase, mitochondrial [Aricia agestis]|uniref:sulfite oxidase, mitochondrial n=1 Tax=Aricia agestis TaxID=91739 RepID=UPI001C20A678|nr:sulfite oxidase, mitochondrial [Aricia agestis]